MAFWLRPVWLRFRTPASVAMSLAFFAGPVFAQRVPAQPFAATIGTLQNPASTSHSAAQAVRVSGAITLDGSTLRLGNGSTVTAGTQTVAVHLTRGGVLDLCATTQVRLSQAQSSSASGALMMSLDRGALEERAIVGKDSDVILTPDLRILISGPGTADIRLRVNSKGDTCLENHVDAVGDIAPYVTVSEQLSDGVYRVQPNQRVLFEQGSLRSVVDNEPEPCGCPAPPILSVADKGTTASPDSAAAPGQAVAANPDTAFPIGESAGLAPPPSLPTQPVVAPGQTHVEVATTLSYDANHPSAKQNFADDAARFGSTSAINNTDAAMSLDSKASATTQPRVIAQPPPESKPGGLLRHIGHFFKRIFG